MHFNFFEGKLERLATLKPNPRTLQMCDLMRWHCRGEERVHRGATHPPFANHTTCESSTG